MSAKNDNSTVRLPYELKKRLDQLATHNDMTIGAYIAALLQPIVDKEFPRYLEAEQKKLRS